MRDDDQKPRVGEKAAALPARRPWARPRLVPLDLSSTKNGDIDGGIDNDTGGGADQPNTIS